MKSKKWLTSLLLVLSLVQASVKTYAEDAKFNTVGVHGYDLVSYQAEDKAVPGNGRFATVFEGVTYLFASEANKKVFEANPQKFLPAFGGYCAYGVSIGKKFDGNPLNWKLIDGKLYLNLDGEIALLWEKDLTANIEKANATWPKIQDKLPSQL